MFTYKKAIQTLNFFARKAEEEDKDLHKTNAIKLIYFADKKHLRNHLRTITGDTYEAKQMGPVAQNTLELIETQRNGEETEAEEMQYANTYITSTEPEWSKKEKKKVIEIKSKKEVDEKQLAKTDLETLTFIWKTYKEHIKPAEKLWEETHRYPEGAKFKKEKKWGPIQEEEMFSSIENDPLGEEDTAEAKELYLEQKEAAKAFGVKI